MANTHGRMKATLMTKTLRHNLPFLIAIACVAMFVEMAYAMVNFIVMPSYLKKAMGLVLSYGAIGSVVLIAQAIFNGPMGAFSDRFGRRVMLVGGPLLSILACLGTIFLHGRNDTLGVFIMIIFRIIDGLGTAMFWPALYASIGDRVDEKEQAGAMGILNATYMLGLAFGPFISGFLITRFKGRHIESEPGYYQPAFWGATLLFGIATVIAFITAPRRSQEKHHKQPSDGSTDPHAPSAVTFKDIQIALKRVPLLLTLGFLIFLAVGTIAPNVTLYTKDELHMSEEAFGNLMLVPALLIAALAVPVGRMGDKWGKPRSVQIGLAMCVASLWSIILIPQQWALIGMGVLIGIGYILAFSSYMAHVSETAGSNVRASISAAVLTAQGVGMGLGAMVLASPLYHTSHILPFYVAAGLLTLGLGLSFVALKKPTQAS
jgi:MFS transporter, DHA1 family, multidrug resistance protein